MKAGDRQPLFWVSSGMWFTLGQAFGKPMVVVHPWLSWIERLTTNQEVPGSNPGGCDSSLRQSPKSYPSFASYPNDICNRSG
jgi:hypothetical protein